MTQTLRLSPTSWNEKGDPTLAAKAGRDASRSRLVEPRARWSYHADGSAADPSDETGFRTLRVLIDVLSSRTRELAALRATCETVIGWSGDSDSSQGGFVLPSAMMNDLAALGCDLYGTTYLDEQ